MPAVSEYLASLNEKGVRLWVENGKLLYRADKGALDSQELLRLRTMRHEIVDELSRSSVLAPLTFQQQWLLPLIQQHPDWQSSQVFSIRLAGLLNVKALDRSVGAVFRRHDALRARVVIVDGIARREVLDASTVPVGVEVVAGGSDFAQNVAAGVRLQVRELTTQGDISTTNHALRVRLLRVSQHEHYLFLLVHRLAADCMSIGQIFRELWLQYGEEIGAQASALPEPAQYRNYALWQQGTDSEWERKHAAYWQERLAGAARLKWPAEDGSTLSGSRAMASVEGFLGSVLSAGLKELGQRTRSLPALIVLTLYVSVVSRWCKQGDFVVPFNVAGRHAAHDGVVGYFSHVLYLRMRLEGNESFADLLRVVSQEFYKGVFHQDFGRMSLRRPEFLQGTLCQWLSWHPAEIASREMYDIPRQFGLTAEPVRFQAERELSTVPPTVTDLDICFFEKGGDIGMLLIFPADRFARQTMERFMGELQATAEHIVNEDRRG